MDAPSPAADDDANARKKNSGSRPLPSAETAMDQHRKQPDEDRGHLLSLRPLYDHYGVHLGHGEKPREVAIVRRIRTPFLVLLLLSLVLAAFTAFYRPTSQAYRPTSQLLLDSPSVVIAGQSTPLNLSHLFFGIGGSVLTWEKRRSFVELWWRPGIMKGHVWLDKSPLGGAENWPYSCPPFRVSGNTTRFGPRVSAARIARVVKEAYTAAPEKEELRWIVLGDDDTVFFPENLLAVLGRYDHREMWYVGGISESVEQDMFHSYEMAYGGGGFAVSLPAAAEISRVLDSCLLRYNRYYGSDHRIQACMSELGVPLTREHGFHQMDIRGSPFGLLTAHPVTPLVSLHHIDYIDPIFPGVGSRTEALERLIRVSRTDPSRTLQQSICYEPRLNWSVSVSWGYAVRVYPRIVFPDELQTPTQTFRTWGSYRDGPFTFNTKPVSAEPCRNPVTFFVDGVDEMGGIGSVTDYWRWTSTERKEKQCNEKGFQQVVEKVRSVRVIAPLMNPNDWKKAPRRQCCEAKATWSWGSMIINVRIRKCRVAETVSPP